jgi:hypothetical protein
MAEMNVVMKLDESDLRYIRELGGRWVVPAAEEGENGTTFKWLNQRIWSPDLLDEAINDVDFLIVHWESVLETIFNWGPVDWEEAANSLPEEATGGLIMKPRFAIHWMGERVDEATRDLSQLREYLTTLREQLVRPTQKLVAPHKYDELDRDMALAEKEGFASA